MKENKQQPFVFWASLPIRLSVIIAFVALIVVSQSCKESNVIGLDVQPESDLLNTGFKDTSTIVSYTVLDKPIRTNGVSVNLLGSYNDPIFGKASASIFTQVKLPNNFTNINFGNDLVFDSLVLTLPYSGYYGTLESQTVKVYQLTDDLNTDSAYYSDKSFSYNSVEIGNTTFKPSPSDSVIVNGVTKAPHLRIKLSDQLGATLLNQPSSNLTNNIAFLNSFKGLYITPANSSQQQGQGAILYFNLTDSLARMTLYYKRTITKKDPSDTSKNISYIDTTNFDFEINISSARFNHFEHDYSASEVANQLADSSLGQNIVYLQQMAGLKTKIKIPYLKNWVDSGPIAVNKAEVILKLDPQYISNNYPVPAKLLLVEIDSLGNSIPLQDFFDGESYYGGDYNSATQEYRFNIVRHVQSILDGKKKDYGLYLLPFGMGGAINANRLVLGGGGNTTYQMKLRLTYTKLY